MFAYSNNGLTMRAIDQGMPLAVGEVIFADYATTAQLTQAFPNYVTALAAATKPAYVPPTPRQWLERLSTATQLSLETAALTNAQVSLWLRKATGNPTIDVTLQETKDGVAAMVTAGLLTAADQTTLLTP